MKQHTINTDDTIDVSMGDLEFDESGDLVFVMRTPLGDFQWLFDGIARTSRAGAYVLTDATRCNFSAQRAFSAFAREPITAVIVVRAPAPESFYDDPYVQGVCAQRPPTVAGVFAAVTDLRRQFPYRFQVDRLRLLCVSAGSAASLAQPDPPSADMGDSVPTPSTGLEVQLTAGHAVRVTHTSKAGGMVAVERDQLEEWVQKLVRMGTMPSHAVSLARVNMVLTMQNQLSK